MRLTLPVRPLDEDAADSGRLGLAAPGAFYGLAGRIIPWFWGAAACFGAGGLIAGLLVSPTIGEHGDAYRIIFVQAPATWMSMIVYAAMAALAALGRALDKPLATLLAAALAPTCALMGFIALWTGALWDKPVWGEWWIWDARLLSQLLVVALCIGFLALRATAADPLRAERQGAVLLLVGAVSIPIHFLGTGAWRSLPLGQSLDPASGSGSLAFELGMGSMAAAFLAWCVAVGLHRARSLLLEQGIDADWARELPEAK